MTANPAALNRSQVLHRLSTFRHSRTGRAARPLVFDLALYAALWTALLLAPAWWMKLPLAAATAVSISRLFMIGHDACHGSHFAARWANAPAGRLVFLASYTPFSTWELGHNTLHHGFTNLQGKDYGYTPF